MNKFKLDAEINMVRDLLDLKRDEIIKHCDSVGLKSYPHKTFAQKIRQAQEYSLIRLLFNQVVKQQEQIEYLKQQKDLTPEICKEPIQIKVPPPKGQKPKKPKCKIKQLICNYCESMKGKPCDGIKKFKKETRAIIEETFEDDDDKINSYNDFLDNKMDKLKKQNGVEVNNWRYLLDNDNDKKILISSVKQYKNYISNLQNEIDENEGSAIEKRLQSCYDEYMDNKQLKIFR